jgi:hypothetical protein
MLRTHKMLHPTAIRVLFEFELSFRRGWPIRSPKPTIPMIGPPADSDPSTRVEKLRRMVARQQFTGLANDTKWNELLQAMRMRSGWTPAFRFKCIDVDLISRWDREWFFHVPMPFISVLWLEITHSDFEPRLPPRRIDYRPELCSILDKIGLDYVVANEVIRIFGYAPRELPATTMRPAGEQ